MTRCLFCKKDSSSSKSAEHIIPESLGNTAQVLPPGIVCDACNNYFSREIEKPFLEAPAIAALRFHQTIPSKRGRLPSIPAILAPEFPASLFKDLKTRQTILSLDPQGVQHLLRNPGGTLWLPGTDVPPPDLVVSRFLAKVGLEAMAQRLQQFPQSLAYLVDEAQLDPVRRHAREGHPKFWPYNVRRIHDPDRHFADETGKEIQTVHEYDILRTTSNEWYFVVAIFGLELAINLGGPDIEGYHLWLQANCGASPLYQNGTPPPTPPA
jgi:hypothetical protein